MTSLSARNEESKTPCRLDKKDFAATMNPSFLELKQIIPSENAAYDYRGTVNSAVPPLARRVGRQGLRQV